MKIEINQILNQVVIHLFPQTYFQVSPQRQQKDKSQKQFHKVFKLLAKVGLTTTAQSRGHE